MFTDYTDIHQAFKKHEKFDDIYDTSKSTFIILNKSGGYLKKCLESVKDAIINTSDKHEIILADIDSPPDIVEDIMINYPSIRIIKTAKKIGWIELANLSIREATYNTIYLINSNILISRDIINSVNQYFENSNLFAISPYILAVDEDSIAKYNDTSRSKYIYRSKLKLVLNSEVGELINNDFTDTTCPTLSSTSGMMIFNKQKFIELSGFKNIYSSMKYTKDNFYFWADIDLCYRAWKRGWGTIFLPDARMFYIDKIYTDAFFLPVPYFMLKEYTSQISAYLFHIKSKYAWKKNSYIFLKNNITNRNYLKLLNNNLKKLITQSFLKFNFLEILCYLSAKFTILLKGKDQNFYNINKYTDENILNIIDKDHI